MTMHDDSADDDDDLAAGELFSQAAANAQALICATVGALRDQGAPITPWFEALGTRFARAWETDEPWTAVEFLDAILINFRSLGAEVAEGTPTVEAGTARASLTGFPDEDLCATLGVEPADVAVYAETPRKIAAACGLGWDWAYAAGSMRLTVGPLSADE